MLSYFIVLLAFMAPTQPNLIEERLNEKVKEHNLQKEEIVMLVDYSLPIKEKRFFVYNTRKKEVLYSDYVGHAYKSGQDHPVRTSNGRGSLKTSLGLYRIGQKYDGSYGESFRLKGLSMTNSNAYKRYIVVHTIVRPNSTMEFDEKGSVRYVGPEKNKLDYLYSEGCFVFYQESYPEVMIYMKKGRYLLAFR